MRISSPPMLLQIALFGPFYGRAIFHCVCVYSHIYIYIYMYVCIHHIFFIHSSVDGHLCCFYVLAIIHSAAMNIGMHAFFQIIVFFRYMPRSGIAGSYGSSIIFFFVFFKGTSILLFIGAVSVYIPTNRAGGF